MRILISLLINILALYIGELLLPGVYLEGIRAAIFAGIVLSLANLIVKPILTFITLPITILTLGLFLLVVNALVLLLVDEIVPGFEIKSFLWAIILGIVLWLLNWIFESIASRRD